MTLNNMTTKNTILISAATCLAVHFLLWLLGWMVWPIVWAASGIIILKVGDWLSTSQVKSPLWIKALALLLGPITVLPFVISSLDGETFDFKKLGIPDLPKIRNPFIWPND